MYYFKRIVGAIIKGCAIGTIVSAPGAVLGINFYGVLIVGLVIVILTINH